VWERVWRTRPGLHHASNCHPLRPRQLERQESGADSGPMPARDRRARLPRVAERRPRGPQGTEGHQDRRPCGGDDGGKMVNTDPRMCSTFRRPTSGPTAPPSVLQNWPGAIPVQFTRTDRQRRTTRQRDTDDDTDHDAPDRGPTDPLALPQSTGLAAHPPACPPVRSWDTLARPSHCG
jgi:hypothetical protein